LVKTYGIKSAPKEPLHITFLRMVPVFPSVAMDFASTITMGPVSHMTMSNLVNRYPKAMMCAGFPSLIPRKDEEYAELLLSVYLLYQVEVSMVLNPEFKKPRTQGQKRTVEGFARAAM
ncbi:unnamed protein product, partial [Ixodes hexagonus]